MAMVYRLVRERDEGGVEREVRVTDSGPGPWFIDYFDASGRRHREVTDAQTKTEAQALLRSKLSDKVKATILGISDVGPIRTTLEEFLRVTYLPHVKATRRAGTAKHYEVYAERIIRSLGKLPLRMIGKTEVQRYMDDRIKAGRTRHGKPLAKASVNREMAFLRACLYDALGRGLIDRNPCARMRLLHEENTRTRVLTDLEEGRLLDHADEWFRPFLKVATLSGLRMGEIRTLTWDAVDRERALIFVGHESKNHKRREVPILPELDALLHDQPRRVVQGHPSPFVFTRESEQGGPYESHDLENAFKRVRQRARVKDVHFHDLRRTFASRLAQRGVSLQAIAKLLGHGATYVTERYAHLSCDDLREAVGRLAMPAPAAQVGRILAVPTFRHAVPS